MGPHPRRIAGASVLVVVSLSVGLVTGAGGDSGSATPPRQAAATAQRDLGLKSCAARFDEYQLGSSFAGLSLAAEPIRQCSDPEPVASDSAGGKIDPDSLGRNHSVTYVYGDCAAKSDMGCAPPLEVQTWPACERSPSDYTIGEPESAGRLEPSETTEIRGVPARFYGDQRLELSAGDVTIVLFGGSKKLLLEAAGTLSSAKGSPDAVAADDPLPAPITGAQEGTLPC